MARPLDQVFDHNVTITPGIEGSFIVYTGVGPQKCGFTDVVDLMAWLQRAAQAQQAAETMVLTEVYEGAGKPGIVPGRRFMTNQDDIPLADGTLSGAIRRTTALGSLADRMAAADLPKGAA